MEPPPIDPAKDSLPELLAGMLDDAGIRALLDDLEGCAEGLEIRRRDAGAELSTPGTVTLEHVRDLLLKDKRASVQLRYRYQGRAWCDSLLARDGSYRLVRMEVTDES